MQRKCKQRLGDRIFEQRWRAWSIVDDTIYYQGHEQISRIIPANYMTKESQLILCIVILLITLSTSLSQQQTASPITIPLEITGYGGIIIQARINNSQPMSFYLDSGASATFFINATKTTALGLKLQGRVLVGGGAGPNSYETSSTNGLTITLDQQKFTDQSATVMNLHLIEEQLGRPVDGLVGVDLFLNYVVEIDYTTQKLKLYDPKSYFYPGTGESLPLELQDRHFFIPAAIELPGRKSLSGRFLIDTGGCMMTAVLTTPFAQQNGLPTREQKTILDQSIAGLGGGTSLLVGRASSFRIGHSVLENALIYISQDNAGALASSDYEGLIGTEILRKFKLIFDYPRRRLIFERNGDFNAPLEYDMSGLSLRAYGKDFRTFKVHQVLKGSPASVAGLRVGDIIGRIDRIPAAQLTLEQVLQMMKVPAREYTLTIKRGNKVKVVRLKTRKLI